MENPNRSRSAGKTIYNVQKATPKNAPVSSLSHLFQTSLIFFFFFGSNMTNFPSVNNSGKGQIQKWRLKVQKHKRLIHLIFFIFWGCWCASERARGTYLTASLAAGFLKKFCSQQTLVIFLKDIYCEYYSSWYSFLFSSATSVSLKQQEMGHLC